MATQYKKIPGTAKVVRRGLNRMLASLAFFAMQAVLVQANVVINEIMYHPPSDLEVHDFLELHNTGASTVNLQDWCVGGIDFCFGAGASIPAGGFIVIAKDAAAFEALYGIPADHVYNGNLSNSGELLSLRNASSIVVDAVEYSDSGFWPPLADGEGASLERIDPTLGGNTPRNWRASIDPVGHTVRSANSVLAVGLPPWITQVEHTQDAEASTPIHVTCRVEDADAVELTYKINFDTDVTLAMHDDGEHNDGAAGDGIYGQTLPGQQVNTLIRYRITADGATGSMRYPRSDDTINYFGLHIPDPELTSDLPIFHWFMEPVDYDNAIAHKLTDEVEPAVFVYNGAVYDNVMVRVRGDTSRVWPKNHWKFKMAHGHNFDAPELIERSVDQFNLQCHYSDKSYMREILAYETFRDAGAPSNQTFHVRLQQNDAFYGLYNFLESADSDYLQRNGLSTDGAWYKSDDDCRLRPLADLPNEYQKVRREYEDFTDLHQLLTGINSLTGQARQDFIFDNIYIPEMINYIAAQCVIHNNDHVAKNFYLFRDTEGTRRWFMQTWDMDLTFGRNFGAAGGVLSDGIWADDDAPHPTNPLVSPSHPLFGDTNHRKWDDRWNRMINVLHADPKIRQMYFRRLRTLMDAKLADNSYEDRIDALSPLVAAEAALDAAKWGQYGQAQTLTQAIDILKNDYLAVRRVHLFQTHRVSGSIPEAQSLHPQIIINELMYNPPDTQDAEFLELYNPSPTESVDLSGWRVDGLGLTLPAGVVILPMDYALLVKNDVVFRATYGSGKFVAAQYTGNLDNGGETITLRHSDGTIIDIVHYDDVSPWPTSPDGGGTSLELIDASRDNNRAGNWAASLVAGGTPGAANSISGFLPEIPNLFVNEVLLSNTSGDLDEAGDADPWIEIYNAGSSTVELGGMYLTDNYAITDKWQIPENTPLCAGQFLVFWADNEPSEGPLHTNFRLNASSASVGLYASGGVLVDYLNTPTLTSGFSYGRLPDGGIRTYELQINTPGARNSGDASPMILNEYNAVLPNGFLKDGASDTYWGRIIGNGGDWFELVVTRDHLDARGWKLVVANNAGIAAPVILTLTDHPIWSNLRSGTIITVSEDLPDDVSFDPANGDWWINAQASASASGTYITNANFDVTQTNWQLTIKDATGQTVFGPAGEGIQPASGIGNDEVFKLEEDPGAHVHPRSNYTDGVSSSFGSPNIYSGGTLQQDFTELRSNLVFCDVPSECDDGNPCTLDECIDGECVNTPVIPCDQLSIVPVGQSGPTFFACSGEQLFLSLDMAGVHTAINGLQAFLEYDATQLSLHSVVPGDGAGSPWDSAAPIYLNDTGSEVQYASVLLGSSTAQDSTVATFIFDVVPPGGNEIPTYVRFATLCQQFQTKMTTVANQTIIPGLNDSGPIVTGPRMDLTIQLEGLGHAVTREVTFVLTTCGEPVQMIEMPVSFNSSGIGTATLTNIDPAAVWINAFEGHTLRRRLPVNFTEGCFSTVSFTDDNRLLAGDFGALNTPKDNFVDVVDFAILAVRWNTLVSDCESGPPADCRYGADITGDGMQNTIDFTALQINFLKLGDRDNDCATVAPSPPSTGGFGGAHVSPVTASTLLPARLSSGSTDRSNLATAELNALGIHAALADMNSDGRIDHQDIRLFASYHQLDLLPEFEQKLVTLETASTASLAPMPQP